MKSMSQLLGVMCLTGLASGSVRAEDGDRPVSERDLRQSYEIEVQAYVPPVLERTVVPSYREELKRAGVQGEVRLSGRIDQHGKIADLTVVEGHPVLASAAKSAVSRWSYAPASFREEAVPVDLEVVIDFRLQQGPRAGGAARAASSVKSVAYTLASGHSAF